MHSSRHWRHYKKWQPIQEFYSIIISKKRSVILNSQGLGQHSYKMDNQWNMCHKRWPQQKSSMRKLKKNYMHPFRPLCIWKSECECQNRSQAASSNLFQTTQQHTNLIAKNVHTVCVYSTKRVRRCTWQTLTWAYVPWMSVLVISAIAWNTLTSHKH